MNGSKKARNAQSIMNRPTLGGPKKSGQPHKVGIPSNLYPAYQMATGAPGNFPIYRGITTKGIIGNFPGRGL